MQSNTIIKLRKIIRENILNILKEEDVKIYLKPGEKPPKGKKVHKGPKGGIYFIGTNAEKQSRDGGKKDTTKKKPRSIFNISKSEKKAWEDFWNKHVAKSPESEDKPKKVSNEPIKKTVLATSPKEAKKQIKSAGKADSVTLYSDWDDAEGRYLNAHVYLVPAGEIKKFKKEFKADPKEENLFGKKYYNEFKKKFQAYHLTDMDSDEYDNNFDRPWEEEVGNPDIEDETLIYPQ